MKQVEYKFNDTDVADWLHSLALGISLTNIELQYVKYLLTKLNDTDHTTRYKKYDVGTTLSDINNFLSSSLL